MECQNHPGTQAVGRCTGCSEAFCENCLVDIQGVSYCASCKTMAVQNTVIAEEATIPCIEARDALIYSIIGLFCLGFIFGPIAISKALTAKRMIEANPRLTGSGKATAAIIIGSIALVFWILNIIARTANLS